MSESLTIQITLPRAFNLMRFCHALRAIGLVMSYSGDNRYTLSEASE